VGEGRRKQARIVLTVSCDVEDDTERTIALRCNTEGMMFALREVIRSAGRKRLPDGELIALLENYGKLWLLKQVGIEESPLSTESAKRLPDCEIVEVAREPSVA